MTPEHKPIMGITGSRFNTESIHKAMCIAHDLGAEPVFLGDHLERVLQDTDLVAELSQNDSACAEKKNAKRADIDMALGLAEPLIPQTVARDLGKIDMLLVMGNDESDVNPHSYNYLYPENDPRHLKTHPETQSEMEYSAEAAVRSKYEEAMILAAAQMHMPLMGVCAGMQRINTVLGGTLNQHIPELTGHDEHSQEPYGIPSHLPVHTVTLVPRTRIDEIARKNNIGHFDEQENRCVEEDSRHHQAVEEPAPGLVAGAHVIETVDGKQVRIVEAIESDRREGQPYADQYIMGVQWHPEYEASPLGKALFAEFIDAGKHYSHRHHREHDDVPKHLVLPLVQPKPAEMKTPARTGSWAEKAAAALPMSRTPGG